MSDREQFRKILAPLSKTQRSAFLAEMFARVTHTHQLAAIDIATEVIDELNKADGLRFFGEIPL